MYKAEDISHWLIGHSNIKRHNEITHLKLQKLLYYFQGGFLSLRQKTLFADDIEAWKYGPVIPSVYNMYAQYNDNPISESVRLFDIATDKIEQDDIYLMEIIYEKLDDYAPTELINITHSHDPWKKTKYKQKISIDLIKDYFEKDIFADVLSGKVFEKIPIVLPKRNNKGELVFPA